LRRVLARVIAACALAVAVSGPLAQRGSAEPFAGARDAGAAPAPIVQTVHGFHCRKMLGWDPVAGAYRYHSHPGICKNYNRCLRVQERCMFRLGAGIQKWTYELLGQDNWRYTDCMIANGCY
jgi:hypothetical protein